MVLGQVCTSVLTSYVKLSSTYICKGEYKQVNVSMFPRMSVQLDVLGLSDEVTN